MIPSSLAAARTTVCEARDPLPARTLFTVRQSTPAAPAMR